MKITATIIHLQRGAQHRARYREPALLRRNPDRGSGSTDRTTELAENLGARVIEANWRGYAGQKNWRADQAPRLGAFARRDESLSEGLEAEIWSLKKSGPRHDGYTIRASRATWAAGFCIPAGIRTASCGSTTGARPNGWATFVHESVAVKGGVRTFAGQPAALHLRIACAHIKTMER